MSTAPRDVLYDFALDISLARLYHRISVLHARWITVPASAPMIRTRAQTPAFAGAGCWPTHIQNSFLQQARTRYALNLILRERMSNLSASHRIILVRIERCFTIFPLLSLVRRRSNFISQLKLYTTEALLEQFSTCYIALCTSHIATLGTRPSLGHDRAPQAL